MKAASIRLAIAAERHRRRAALATARVYACLCRRSLVLGEWVVVRFYFDTMVRYRKAAHEHGRYVAKLEREAAAP